MNRELCPVVKCHWGCGEDYQKEKAMELNIILSLSMGPEGIPFTSSTTNKNAAWCQQTSIRPDFLKAKIVSDEFLLKNPLWEVMPSITFDDGAPVCLVCRDHGKGFEEGQYIHPPENPNGNLASTFGDQLAPAVVRPRTINPVKAKYFSHTFQMHEMRGQFDGVDTIRVTDHGNFNRQSTLLARQEDLTIQGRSDIKAMAQVWTATQEKFPTWLGEEMIQHAEKNTLT